MGSPSGKFNQTDSKIPSCYIYGIGGSFDVYTGNVKRAPKWWVENNLEWAYRLINEPYRIKRQVHLIKLIPMLIFEKSKK